MNGAPLLTMLWGPVTDKNGRYGVSAVCSVFFPFFTAGPIFVTSRSIMLKVPAMVRRAPGSLPTLFARHVRY